MEVGLAVGGKVASTGISKLINGIIDYAKDQKKMQLGLKDELKRLEKDLPKIQAVVNAIDQGLIKENPELEKWLWQLRDAADQADDVMDEIEYNFVKEKVEAGKKKVSKAVSNFRTFLERAVHKDIFLRRLKVAVEAIDDVASNVGVFYMLVQDLVKNQKELVMSTTNHHETSPVLNVGNCVFGREKEEEDIIKKLLNPVCKAKEVNFAVLPIIGAGGVGKTTLAQLVYNDSEVVKHFELRMWVCVSNNFDVKLLTKKLYESAFGQREESDYLASIQNRIEEKLMSKKFLIVFDDAWNDKDRIGWEKLVAPLKCGKSGSMILLTTRMKTVARLIGPNVMDSVNLEGLNEHDMWDLLKEYAFGGEDPNNHKELVTIGKGIVTKLRGSPLAAKTVGGILSSHLNEIHWTSVSDSELWSLKQDGPNEIMAALILTYQHLPPHLKPCFSFCSIFPQDHIFIKDDLINMWLALGLVPRDFYGAMRPEDIGSQYFEDMLNRSIFSPANPVRNGHLHYPAYTYCSVTDKQFVGGYLMHDLMHDLSTFVSQGECVRSCIDKLATVPITVRHLYIQVGTCSELSNFNLKNIRTLILHFDDYDHPKQDYIVNELLKKSKSLRVLAVFALKLNEFPKSASDLLHLRYLSLSSFKIREFPISIYKLYFLETMVCGGFGFEKPSQSAGLVGLINIRHLIVSEDFVETIAGLGRLTSLQELSCRVGKSSGFKICELGDMRELRCLSISNVDDIGSQDEAIQANIRNKVSLCKLSLKWETENFDKKVFEHLEPHCNLKELRIRNYMGGRLPPWLRTQAFSKLEVLTFESLKKMEEWSLIEKPDNWMQCLRELNIYDCPNLLNLPALPASLKKLKLQGLGLYYLPNLLKDHTGCSSSLVSMEITDCPNLASLAEGFLQNPEQFTSLEELIIMNCRELETPPDGFSKYISLKRLDISDCPKIKLLFVHRFSLPSTLQFFHIDSYAEDIQAEMRHEDNARELSLPSVPALQTGEAKLVVFDLSRPFSNLELRISSMRNYMGRWSHFWLTQTLSHLKYLNIDGNLYLDEYRSEKLPDGINQILKSICQEESTGNPDLDYHSTTLEVQEIYLATEHIKWIQSLKRLSIGVRSKSWVMPNLPITLKELILSNLLLARLQIFGGNQSCQWRCLPSLVKLEISDCPNLVSLDSGLHEEPEQFAALQELIIRNCNELGMPHGGFSKFISLKRLDLSDCPGMKLFYLHDMFLPSTLQFLHLNGHEENFLPNKRNPTLQRDEAKIRSLDLDLRNLRMGYYMGTWPPVWLTQTLSILECLLIHGDSSLKKYHLLELPDYMNEQLELIVWHKYGNERYYVATKDIKRIKCLKKLTIFGYPGSFVMAHLYFTVRELRLHDLRLDVLPNLSENQRSASGSLPSLVSMEIRNCRNLVSLAEGVFQNPQQFMSLEKLTICGCTELRILPEGGFSKFMSLRKLDIRDCPNIQGQLVQECFLPSALQVLCIRRCGNLDAALTQALEIVHSLISLELYHCSIISSLPSVEVLSRWKTLEKLELDLCSKLISLESLAGLLSVKLLIISFCYNLCSKFRSPSAWKKIENEGIIEKGTIQTERKAQLSVDELRINDPEFLSIEPIRSLSSVRKLTIENCSEMKSLPELPPILEELSLYGCSPELQRRCENTGEDWPKLSHILKVSISQMKWRD